MKFYSIRYVVYQNKLNYNNSISNNFSVSELNETKQWQCLY